MCKDVVNVNWIHGILLVLYITPNRWVVPLTNVFSIPWPEDTTNNYLCGWAFISFLDLPVLCTDILGIWIFSHHIIPKFIDKDLEKLSRTLHVSSGILHREGGTVEVFSLLFYSSFFRILNGLLVISESECLYTNTACVSIFERGDVFGGGRVMHTMKPHVIPLAGVVFISTPFVFGKTTPCRVAQRVTHWP